MSQWSTDKIVCVGLVTALLMDIIGSFVTGFFVGDFHLTDVAKEIAIGLVGCLGRSSLESKKISQIKKDEGDNDENIH